MSRGRFKPQTICRLGHPKPRPGACRICINARNKRFRDHRRASRIDPSIFKQLATKPWLACI